MSAHASFTPGDDRGASPLAQRHPDLYANHLILADFLTRWAADLQSEVNPSAVPVSEADYLLGYQRALTDLAAHLAEGDGLPGGAVATHLRRCEASCA